MKFFFAIIIVNINQKGKMISSIAVENCPLQLLGHKIFQIFIHFHVIYNFSKIPYTDIAFIPSTGIYYQVVPVREQQLSILPLDGFEMQYFFAYACSPLPLGFFVFFIVEIDS